MPLVHCPRCGREITVTADEVVRGLRIECADCFTRFDVCVQPAPAPAYRSPAEEEGDFSPPVYAPPPRRFPATAAVVAVAGVLLALGCGVVVAVVANRSDKRAAAATARPASRPAPRPAPAFDAGRDFEAERREAEAAAAAFSVLGFTALFWGTVCVAWIVYLALVVLLLAWVARDARARSVDGGAVWVLVIFLTGPVGFLVYLASRPQGILVPCGRCGNKRLMAALLCPHCGQAAPAA